LVVSAEAWALASQWSRLARREARRAARRRDLVEDLEQEGMLELYRSALRFEASRGAAFSTFAVPAVRHRVRDAMRTSGHTLGIGRNAASALARLRRVRAKLEAARRPTTRTALAAELGITVDRVHELERLEAVARLDETRSGDDGDRTPLRERLASDAPSPEDLAERQSVARFVRRHVDALPAEDRTLVIDWARGATLERLAKARGVCVDVVRARVYRALHELRHSMARPA